MEKYNTLRLEIDWTLEDRLEYEYITNNVLPGYIHLPEMRTDTHLKNYKTLYTTKGISMDIV